MRSKLAVFLDRDGVLTVEKGYVHSIEDLEIFPYAKECIRLIHEKGYLAIVVTNQSGVARGYFTETQLLEMNRYLMQETGVDAVYYCPHYENGVIEKYAYKCNCRKPEVGLVQQACQDFHIDLRDRRKLYMIGDRVSDIRLGQNMGFTTVLLESGYGTGRMEGSITPDYILEDLRDVIKIMGMGE